MELDEIMSTDVNAKNQFSQLEGRFNIGRLTPRDVLWIFQDFLTDQFVTWIRRDFDLSDEFLQTISGYINLSRRYRSNEISIEELIAKRREAWNMYDNSTGVEKIVTGMVIGALGSENDIVLNNDEEYVSFDFFGLLFGYMYQLKREYCVALREYLESHPKIASLEILDRK